MSDKINTEREMTVVYYIKHPNGRTKITPVPASDTEAIRTFKDHWTAKAAWSVNGKRVLVKEIKEEIFAEDVFNVGPRNGPG